MIHMQSHWGFPFVWSTRSSRFRLDFLVSPILVRLLFYWYKHISFLWRICLFICSYSTYGFLTFILGSILVSFIVKLDPLGTEGLLYPHSVTGLVGNYAS